MGSGTFLTAGGTGALRFLPTELIEVTDPVLEITDALLRLRFRSIFFKLDIDIDLELEIDN